MPFDTIINFFKSQNYLLQKIRQTSEIVAKIQKFINTAYPDTSPSLDRLFRVAPVNAEVRPQ